MSAIPQNQRRSQSHKGVPQPKRSGDVYSGQNPVPNVQRFTEEQHRNQEIAKEQLRLAKRKGLPRQVHDPITRGQVEIQDLGYTNKSPPDTSNFLTMRRSQLADNNTQTYPSVDFPTRGRRMTEADEEIARREGVIDKDGFIDLPLQGRRSNVLFYPLHDTDYNECEKNINDLYLRFVYIIAALGAIKLVIFDFGTIPLFLVIAAAAFYILNEMKARWSVAKARGEIRRAETAIIDKLPESVEWLNQIISIVWHLLNPDLFTSIVDQIEDVMQASIPSIVHAVAIRDFAQGKVPIRILSIRSILDDEISQQMKEGSSRIPASDTLNLEISLRYSGDYGPKAEELNSHLMVVFYTGLKNVVGIPIPIWVQLRELICTVRVRIEFFPNLPFVQSVTISFMGLPRIEISAVPMHQRFFNVFNLPIISKFIKDSISTAANEFVAPKSFSIELGEKIMKTGPDQDSKALGVIWIHIRSASKLSPQDTSGKSDPYLVVSYSKYGKPLYCTRIIVQDLNPIWNETAAVLVTKENLDANENLSLQLWDSDRFSADDELGRVEFGLNQIVKSPNRLYYRSDDLIALDAGKPMPGNLEWQVGFFPKVKYGKKNEHKPNFMNCQSKQENTKRMKSKGKTKSALSDDHLSGILSIKIQQADKLEMQKIIGTYSERETIQTRVMDVYEQEEKQESPSSYCNVILNDQLIYRTRTKPYSSRPFFNAGTERFIRNWKTTILIISMRDLRTREHDTLIGAVPLDLKEVFANSRFVSRHYPLIGGLGNGYLKITLSFHPVTLKLTSTQLGWDIGVVRIAPGCIRIRNIDDKKFDSVTSIRLRAGSYSKRLSSRQLLRDNCDLFYTDSKPVVLPYNRRYSSSLIFELNTGVSRKASSLIAILWLCDLEDSRERDIKLPIWKATGDSLHKLKIEYTGETYNAELLGDLKQVGILYTRLAFVPGIRKSHSKLAKDSSDLRQVQEAHFALKNFNMREQKGRFKKSLTQEDASDRNYVSSGDNDMDDASSSSYANESDAGDLITNADENLSEPSRQHSNQLLQRYSTWRGQQKNLHRNHRGVMQWKAARTANWTKNGVHRGMIKLRHLFSMKGRRVDIETEV